MFTMFAFVMAAVALVASLRMNDRQRHEYAFFIAEYRGKTGKTPAWIQKVKAWNAAMGGPAPTWHWLEPVVSSAESFSADWHPKNQDQSRN